MCYPGTTFSVLSPPAHNQIRICFSLRDSTGSTLITPWNSARLQSSTGPRQVVAGLGAPWDFFWVAWEPALVPSFNLYKPGEYHLPLNGNSLRTCLIQLVYCPRYFRGRSLTGRWQAEAGLGVLWPFFWSALGLAMQFGPSHMHPNVV